MGRPGSLFRQGLVEDLETRLNTSAEALKSAIDAKEKLEMDPNNKKLRADALSAATSAKEAYANLDRSIEEVIGDTNLLKMGAKSRYPQFARYFISSLIGGTTSKILYDLVGPLYERDTRSKTKLRIADERELFNEIDNKRVHRYYYGIRVIVFKMSSMEMFSTITKALEYVKDNYPVPVVSTATN